MTIDSQDYHGNGHPGRAAGKDLADEMGIFTMEFYVYIYIYVLLILNLCVSIHIIILKMH